MKTKAQGLTLNTIIIAVLVLVVLVILIFIFSGKMGDFMAGVNACDGTCRSSASSCTKDQNPVFLTNCDDGSSTSAGNYCCMAKQG